MHALCVRITCAIHSNTIPWILQWKWRPSLQYPQSGTHNMSQIFVDIAVDMVNLPQYLQSLLAIFRHTQGDCGAISTAITKVGQHLQQYPRFLQFLLQYLRSKTISTTIPTVISTTISTGIQNPL